jgi:hypothetical protein
MLQDPCQRAYTNAKMRRLGFAAFRECIALEQRRLLMHHTGGPTTGAPPSWWRSWLRQARNFPR